MTLWNIIRDFFVQYIFGGFSSSGTGYYNNFIGSFVVYDNAELIDYAVVDTSTGVIPINLYLDGDVYYDKTYLSVGDWLSTTATIIVLCAICVFLFFFVRWLFRLTAGLISGRG